MLRLFALLLVGGALWAHHSVNAEYDMEKPMEYRATVVRTEWMNPHVLAHATVDGREVVFEIGAPNSMTRKGWTKDLFQQGEALTIVGFPSRDGSSKVNVRRITWADGRSMEHVDYWGMTR